MFNKRYDNLIEFICSCDDRLKQEVDDFYSDLPTAIKEKFISEEEFVVDTKSDIYYLFGCNRKKLDFLAERKKANSSTKKNKYGWRRIEVYPPVKSELEKMNTNYNGDLRNRYLILSFSCDFPNDVCYRSFVLKNENGYEILTSKLNRSTMTITHVHKQINEKILFKILNSNHTKTR